MIYSGAVWRPLPFFRPGGIQPIGVICHYSVSCGDPWQDLYSQGLSAHFNVRQDGVIEQYVDTDNLAFHADNANPYYIGIEHTALPGVCDLNVAQLSASAQLSAWISLTYGIPVIRSYGCAFTPGFKAHYDGLEPGCTNWNLRSHTDGIWQADVPWLTADIQATLNRSPWTWYDYASAINTNIAYDQYYQYYYYQYG